MVTKKPSIRVNPMTVAKILYLVVIEPDLFGGSFKPIDLIVPPYGLSVTFYRMAKPFNS